VKVEEDLAGWLSAKGVRIRRRVRILMLLDADDYAMIAPISIARFHAFAFLADVLSPIYHFVPLSGRILKRRAGPYFPDLQWEIDRLVGLGLVTIYGLVPVVETKEAYIEAALSLDRSRSEALLELVHAEPEFRSLRDFFRELAGALSNIEDVDLDAATRSDVTWEAGPKGAVIDYAEWRATNFSTKSADRIEQFATRAWGSDGAQLSPGAKINLYVQYMRRAANG
jgi:hypothetical protein